MGSFRNFTAVSDFAGARGVALLLLALSPAAQLLGGCGGDGGGEGACGVGESCPCTTALDCPDPLVETCSLVTFTCEAIDGGDAGTDTDLDGGSDTSDAVDTDTTEDADAGADTDLDVDGDTEDADVVEPDTTDTGPTDVSPTDAADTADTEDVAVDTAEDVEEDITVPAVFELFDPWIAFQSNRPDGLDQIWVIPSSGGTAIHINTGDLAAESPSWGPDGTEIAYIGRGRGTRDLRIVDVTTGEVRTITLSTPVLAIESPDWSYDGSYIVVDGFIDTSGVGRDIFLVRVSDGQVTRLTTDEADDYGARFDRFGRIFFVSRRSGAGEIWGTGRLPETEYDTGAGVEVLGRIAVGPEGDVVVATLDGTGDAVDLARVTLETGDSISVGSDTDASPEVWPDGYRVTFTTTTFGGSDLANASLTTGLSSGRVTSSADNTARNINASAAPVEHLSVEIFYE